MHVHGTSSVQQCTAVLHLVTVVNHHMNKKCEDFELFKVGMLECLKLRVVDKASLVQIMSFVSVHLCAMVGPYAFLRKLFNKNSLKFNEISD